MPISPRPSRFVAIAFAVVLGGSETMAQTSNCMAMGGGMVNCRSSDGSMTNCMGMGPDMATCQTTGGANAGSDEADAMLLRGIGSLIGRISDGPFRKHVGQMLASGDCQGAANYAFAKGKLEMGNSILQTCRTYSAPPPPRPVTDTSSADLPAMIQKTASLIRTPMPLSENVTLVRLEPLGSQLLLTARVDTPLPGISDDARRRVEGEMCGHPALMPLLHYGASIRIAYIGRNGHDIGAVMVTKQICGFR